MSRFKGLFKVVFFLQKPVEKSMLINFFFPFFHNNYVNGEDGNVLKSSPNYARARARVRYTLSTKDR